MWETDWWVKLNPVLETVLAGNKIYILKDMQCSISLTKKNEDRIEQKLMLISRNLW